MRNIGSLLYYGETLLKSLSSSPRLDSELIMSHVLQCSRTQLIVRSEDSLSSAAQEHFLSVLKRTADPMAI